ncbi:unnamed protein product, partial [Rotaria socialis]
PERIDAAQAPEGYGIRSDMWALGLSTVNIIVVFIYSKHIRMFSISIVGNNYWSTSIR